MKQILEMKLFRLLVPASVVAAYALSSGLCYGQQATPAPSPALVSASDGKEAPAQISNGKVLFVAKVPSVGYAVYDVQPSGGAEVAASKLLARQMGEPGSPASLQSHHRAVPNRQFEGSPHRSTRRG